MINLNCICFIALLFFISGADAASITMFNHAIDDNESLSKQIHSSFQDHTGYLWFGTSQGAVQFDGYSYKQVLKVGNNLAISNASVMALTEDDSGRIWMATYEEGLLSYSPWNEEIIQYTANPQNSETLSSNTIRSLAMEGSTLWIGTNAGLDRMNLDTGAIKHFSSKTKGHLPANTIRSLLIASSRTVWAAPEQGLYTLLPDSAQFQLIENSSLLQIRTILERSNQQMLFGTNKGLYAYNVSTNKLTHTLPSLDATILSLAEDHSDNLWIGTMQQGIFLSQNDKLKHYQRDNSSSKSLGGDSIRTLLIDSTNTLWSGSFSFGLDWINLETLQFNSFDGSQNSLTCLSNPTVYSIAKRSNGSLWIGSYLELIRIDPTGYHCKAFKHDPKNPYSIPNYAILSLFEDSKNNLWIGTEQGVSILYEQDTHFTPSPKGIPKIAVYNIFEDRQGNIFIACMRGLYVRKVNSIEFVKVESDITELTDSAIIRIEQDSLGRHWIASSNGILTLSNNFKLEYPSLRNSMLRKHDFFKNKSLALLIDSQSQIWIGVTNQGLFILDSSGKLIHSFEDVKQLSAINGFMSIVESSDGQIVISSIHGLTQINTDDWKLSHFNESDGIPSREFTLNAHFADSDGNVYFGSRSGGFTQFHAKSIKKNTILAKPQLTNFLYFDTVINVRDKNTNFQLTESISTLEDLFLSYQDQKFGFEFSALHFAAPKENQFAYIMENYDEKWIYTNAKNRRASYNNLPAGDYTFKLKASNNHGLWNDEPVQIRIHISPPPWATWWAYTFYILFSSLTIYGFINFRTRALKLRSLALEQSVKQRTQELAEEKSKVEKLLSRKNDEFANVSHEFRTPLTLILGPTEQLLKEADPTNNNKLRVIQRNGFRLLRMVDQLLNMESFRVKAITQKSIQSSHHSIRLIAEAFKDLAYEKGIRLTITHLEPIHLIMVPDALDKIVLNILSNALKYTQKNGYISVASFRTQSNRLHIQITDSGIGIADTEKDLIFDRFHRILDRKSEQVTGAGIGLALVKELINAHDGSIEIDSRIGEGTEVNIYIPIHGGNGENNVKAIESTTNQEIIDLELMSLGKQSQSITNLVVEKKLTKSTHILIVEDNSDMQHYIVECLQDIYNLSVADNGKLGLEKAIDEVPDIIISDIMMPEMDGYQLTKAIRDDSRINHIPIILLTAKSDQASKLKGWKEKADEYLTKPFDVRELLIRINNLLEIRNLLRRQFSHRVLNEPLDLSNTTSDHEGKYLELAQQKFLSDLDKVLEILYKNNELKIPEIANKLAVSNRQLFRKLKAIVNMNTSEYLRNFRLKKACILLEKGISPSFTALEVGFMSLSYFGRCFKARYSCSPSDYQTKISSELSTFEKS